MEKIRKLIRKLRFHAGLVLKKNSSSTFYYLKLLDLLRIERDIELTLFDMAVTTRSATPDLQWVLASLGTEFDDLAEDYPHDGDDLIIDAGGYIVTAAIALAKIYPACTNITIKPSSKNFATFLKNTEGFKNIRPINTALTVESRLGSVELMSRKIDRPVSLKKPRR